jgi:glycosyltransferase involved in cell wall biosynthesis
LGIVPKVSVIVPARDAANTLARTLSSLQALEPVTGGHEVIVVDDGSRDATAAVAARHSLRPRVIVQEALGPGEARNAGVAAAQAELLAFCDADVYPCPGWLRAGARALEDLDLAQGLVLPAGPVRPFDRTIWVLFAAGLFEAANLFVRRKTFDAVGGFEDWLRPRRSKPLAEDVWFGWRVRRAGARCGFCPEAEARHEVFPRHWTEYVAERARLRFFPAMVARVPELRESFLHRRVFLNRRTLRFDLAVGAALLALAAGHPLPLAATVPYLRQALGEGDRGGANELLARTRIVAADAAADAVGLLALLAGTARYGAIVL